MSKDTFSDLTNQLSTFINNNSNTTPPPMIGVITHVSSDLQYCDITTDQGTINNVPAHGLPVNGDSAIIHFINGNYEQPVADCARRLPATDSTLEEYYGSDCKNYHENGDLSRDNYGYTGNYELTSEDYYTINGEQSILLKDNTNYISFNTEIPSTSAEYIKFQCYYKGEGQLRIQATNTDTSEVINTLPVNNSHPYKIWETQGSRWTWNYNKETYPSTNENNKIQNMTITINNITTQETTIIDGVPYNNHTAMLVDGLLIYDEDNDTEYYQNINDVI